MFILGLFYSERFANVIYQLAYNSFQTIFDIALLDILNTRIDLKRYFTSFFTDYWHADWAYLNARIASGIFHTVHVYCRLWFSIEYNKHVCCTPFDLLQGGWVKSWKRLRLVMRIFSESSTSWTLIYREKYLCKL